MSSPSEEPEWVHRAVVLAIQEDQLAEHGGLVGIGDAGMLGSALSRRQNLFAYCPGSPLHDIAAAYTFGIAKSHAFVDGNKRTAWVVCALFLELNGISVVAPQAEVVEVMRAVAAGTTSESQLALWLQQVATSE